MALEIKEMIVKVTVNEQSRSHQRANAPKDALDLSNSKDAIVQACVKRVLEVLREQSER